MKNVNIQLAFKTGWDNFVRRPWYLFGLTLAMLVLFFFCSSQSAAVTALGYILYGGYIVVLLRHYDHQHIVFDDLFSLDSRWISFAFLGLLKLILILAGLICFVIPGIYLMVRFMFAEFLVLERNMRPVEALKASNAMTQGHFWGLLLFGILSTLFALFGLLIVGVGAVIASIVITFATIRLYRDLQAV